jgi:hypothetical protein
MKRISNRHHDVEHLLFAERLAANADKALSTERRASEDGPHDTGPDAAAVEPRSHADQPSPTGWY